MNEVNIFIKAPGGKQPLPIVQMICLLEDIGVIQTRSVWFETGKDTAEIYVTFLGGSCGSDV